MIAWFGQRCIVRQPAWQAKQDMPRYLTIQGVDVHPEKKSSNKQVRSTNMEDGDQKSCATKTY